MTAARVANSEWRSTKTYFKDKYLGGLSFLSFILFSLKALRSRRDFRPCIQKEEKTSYNVSGNAGLGSKMRYLKLLLP